MKKNMIVLLACLSMVLPSWAQSLTMNDFKQVVEQIKKMSRYSYVTDIDAVFPDGKKDSRKNILYMDAAKKLLFFKNKDEQMVMNSQWFYKASHYQKYVSIFDIARYRERYKGAMGDLSSIFKNSSTATFLDSVLVQQGKIKSGKRIGDLSSYDFSFPKESYLQSVQIIFNHATGLPMTITMRTFFAEPYGDNAQAGTTYSMRCHSYTTNFSDDVFSIASLFTVTGGKAQLLQFKNYKLSSIL